MAKLVEYNRPYFNGQRVYDYWHIRIRKPDCVYWLSDIRLWLRGFKWFRDLEYNWKRRAFDKKQMKQFGYTNYNFKSFWDESTGKMVTSRDEMKEREKEGMVMMTHNEAERIAKDYMNKRTSEHKALRRKSFAENLMRVKQGQSVKPLYGGE